MSHQRLAVGAQGEKAARRYLKKQGYTILARNYTCPAGELDVVALRDQVLIFVEVKTLSASEGMPEERVDFAKQRRLIRVAEYFIREKNLEDYRCQFDVISVTLDDRGRPQVTHFPDAFEG